MPTTRRSLAAALTCAVACALALASAPARATTEVPAVADARSIALGGTGVAYIDNPTAVYLNPANLDKVQQLTITASASPMIITGHAPLPLGPTPSETNMQLGVAPFFLVGAAYRVQERVTVALAAFPALGAGGTYSNVLPGHDLSESFTTIEMAPAVSVRLLDGLSLGASYRISYTSFSVDQPAVSPQGMLAGQDNLSLNGWNFAGLSVGVHYRPIDALEIGFDYRSKITTSLSGQSTLTPVMGPSQSANASMDFSNPHSFRLGAAVYLLDHRLMISLDGKVLLYQDSNGGTSTIQVTGQGSIPNQQNWVNVVGGSLGVEYSITPMIPVRLGYSVTTSATPASTVGAFGIPNTLVHGIHAGVGLVLPKLNVDIGGFYAFDSEDLANTSYKGGSLEVPGSYGDTFVMIGASGTYHF